MFDQKGQWLLGVMARILSVSISGYDNWIKRPSSQRHHEDNHLQ